MQKQDCIPEIQVSYIKKFLNQNVSEKVKFSSNFRKDFSRSISIFLYYLTTIIKSKQVKQNKRITKNDIISTLNEIGFESIAEQLENVQWELKDEQSSKKRKQEDLEGNQDNQQNKGENNQITNKFEKCNIQDQDSQNNQLKQRKNKKIDELDSEAEEEYEQEYNSAEVNNQNQEYLDDDIENENDDIDIEGREVESEDESNIQQSESKKKQLVYENNEQDLHENIQQNLDRQGDTFKQSILEKIDEEGVNW